jgi:DhnA family fructose-bisphosphate aldolase class Ia
MGGKFQELYPDEHVLFVDLEDTFTQNTLALGINVIKFSLNEAKDREDSFEVLISLLKKGRAYHLGLCFVTTAYCRRQKETWVKRKPLDL